MLSMLFVTNSSLKSQGFFPYTGQANPYFPPSIYTIDNLGLGKNISIHKGNAPATYYPKLLVHSSVDDFSTRAILRIQDKVGNNMGSPQIQFWSNEYHTENEWFVGKIQAVTNTSITGSILNNQADVPGGIAFYSKRKEALVNNWQEPVETMRIIDNKVSIGTMRADNILQISPKTYDPINPLPQFDNYSNNFAFDMKINNAGHQSLLQKFYKWTGVNNNSFAWHFEVASRNENEQWDTYGAFNICSRAEEGEPNTEVAANMPPVTGQMKRLLTIEREGNVGIGIINPKEKLHVSGNSIVSGKAIFGTESITSGSHTNYRVAVDGKLLAKEIIVTADGWADFVFEDNYNLPKLSEIESHIKSKKHLPGIPTANEVKTNGANIGEVQVKLLQKIEELTLYLIEQDKKIQELQNQINNK